MTKCRLGRPHLSRPPPGPEPLGSPAPCPSRPPRTGCRGPGPGHVLSVFIQWDRNFYGHILLALSDPYRPDGAAGSRRSRSRPHSRHRADSSRPRSAKTACPPGPPPVFAGRRYRWTARGSWPPASRRCTPPERNPACRSGGRPHTHPPSGPQLPSGGYLPRGETPVSGASDRPFCTSWALARPHLPLLSPSALSSPV